MSRIAIFLALLMPFVANATTYNCEYNFPNYTFGTSSGCITEQTIGNLYCFGASDTLQNISEGFNSSVGGIIAYSDGNNINFITSQDSQMDSVSIDGIYASGSCDTIADLSYSMPKEEYMEFQAWELVVGMIAGIIITSYSILYAFGYKKNN